MQGTVEFVLVDGGDVTFFRSAEDLIRYVELPDVATCIYRVFERSGQEMALRIDGSIIRMSYLNDASSDIRAILERYICYFASRGVEVPAVDQNCDLGCLVDMCASLRPD